MKTCVAWFTVAGCILGVLGATFIYTVERPVFESTAIFRPLRPADDSSGVSHREWLKTEAAALGSEANLKQVVRSLNLETEWSMSAGEAVNAAKERLRVSLPNETTLVQVTVTGTKAQECASLANALFRVREMVVRDAALDRQGRIQSSYKARVKTLAQSSASKRATLIAAVKGVGLTADSSDAVLLAATLPPELSPLRDAWQTDVTQLAYTKEKLAGASLPQILSPYAEVLQYAEPQVNAAGPSWSPRAAWWALMGAGLGLAAGLLVSAVRRRMPPQPKFSSPASPVPLGAVEY